MEKKKVDEVTTDINLNAFYLPNYIKNVSKIKGRKLN